MSGHSKWANIKRRKESVDSKRANIFSKIGKEITVAVKIGGSGDPGINSRLRDVISKAKSQNMPNDNINRCIQKALGDSDTNSYEELTYEGFGPCATSVIVEVMTDNKNRSAADIRSIFNKAGGNLGQTGTVGYMFETKGYILIEKGEDIDSEELVMQLLELDVLDIAEEDEYIEVFVLPEKFSDIRESVEKLNIKMLESDIRKIANMKKELSEEEEEKFQNFLDKLEDNDDVQSVWHNIDM